MRVVAALALLAVLLIGLNSLFVIDERTQAIIVRFGEPVRESLTTPGLKLKAPFIEQVYRFDKRFLEWEGDAEELPTKDKVFIVVDTYARWRIIDPLTFYKRNTDEARAQSRLDDILDGETRNAVAKHELLEVIRSTNRTPLHDDSAPQVQRGLDDITVGREEIRMEILRAAQARLAEADLGIEILDVQLRRINYGEQVLNDVHRRMISERDRIASLYRSEGQGEQARILGEMDRALKQIQSEAYREAEEIRGRADAEAIEIYAQAYNQSPDARRFYEFLKTMESYEATVDKDTWLVLSTDGDFYRFLKGSNR